MICRRQHREAQMNTETEHILQMTNRHIMVDPPESPGGSWMSLKSLSTIEMPTTKSVVPPIVCGVVHAACGWMS